MAIEVWEHVSSPSVTKTNKDGKAETKWIVRGAGDEQSAMFMLDNAVPLAYFMANEVLIRQEIKVSPLGAGLYEASVSYGPEDDPKSEGKLEPLEWKYSFDTAGGKHKISKGEKTASSWCYSMSNQPPDLKGAINYDGKKVNGVEIHVPNLEFTLTVMYAPAAVNPEFIKQMARKTGRVNSDPFLGFEAGEVLFLGAKGDGTIATIRGQKVKPIPVTLSFAMSENRDDILIGSNPEPITKRGWQYLWVRYERMENSGLDYPVPVHAYVEDVYRELAFKPFFKFG